MSVIKRGALALSIVLGLSATASAQDAKWVQPCDVRDAFAAAGRADSDKGKVYTAMCGLLGNDPVAEACLELDAIEEGLMARPGNQAYEALNDTCDAAIVAGPPAEMGEVDTDVADMPADEPATSDDGANDTALELAFWESVKDSDDPAMFVAYLRQYPNGTFAALAEAKISALGAGEGDENDSAAEAPTTVIIEKNVVVPKATTKTTNVAARVQRQLKRVGCYYGAIDGIWGQGSRKAIRRFNRATGRSLEPSRPSTRQLGIIKAYGGRVCR